MICEQCHKVKEEKNFYHYKNKKDNSYYPICKDCLTKNINIYNEDSFLWLFKLFDVPYISDEWIRYCYYNKRKYPNLDNAALNKMTFGKYLSKMKLCSFRSFSFKDSPKEHKNIEQEVIKYFFRDENFIKEATYGRN